MGAFPAAQYEVYKVVVLAHGAAKATKGKGQGKGLVDKETGLIAALQKLAPSS